jgi:pimeloyl-ACP methyl ester carboxylesterase
MEIPPEIRYVEREGRSIAFQQFGSGDRRLVQINAVSGNLDLLWTDAVTCGLMVRGAELFEVVMYDQLGQGLSDPVDHVPTLEERVADLAAVMDAAGFERASISAIFDACIVVLLFAAQYPERRPSGSSAGVTRIRSRRMTAPGTTSMSTGGRAAACRCRCPRSRLVGTSCCGVCLNARQPVAE